MNKAQLIQKIAENGNMTKKDAEKARRGLEIFERKKRADVSLWLYDTKQIREDIEAAEKLWILSKHELEVLEQVISDLEAQDENLYNKAQSNKLLSEQLFNQINEATEKLHKLDNALRVAETEVLHSRELIQQCNDTKFGKKWGDGTCQNGNGHDVKHRVLKQGIGGIHQGVEHIGNTHLGTQIHEECEEQGQEDENFLVQDFFLIGVDLWFFLCHRPYSSLYIRILIIIENRCLFVNMA